MPHIARQKSACHLRFRQLVWEHANLHELTCTRLENQTLYHLGILGTMFSNILCTGYLHGSHPLCKHHSEIAIYPRRATTHDLNMEHGGGDGDDDDGNDLGLSKTRTTWTENQKELQCILTVSCRDTMIYPFCRRPALLPEYCTSRGWSVIRICTSLLNGSVGLNHFEAR